MIKERKAKQNINKLKNIIFILKIIEKAAPGRIFIDIVKSAIEKIYNVLFFIYLIQYIFRSIETGTAFNHLFRVISFAAIGYIAICIMQAWHNYYSSISNCKIFKYVCETVEDKASEIELSRFEDPNFYNQFTRVLDESTWRAGEVLKNITDIVGTFCGIFASIILIISWDPFLLLFIIIPILNSFAVGKVRNRIQYEKDMSLTMDNRVAEYSKRIFYEKKYAQEIRLFSIKDVFLDKHEKSYKNIINTMKKYGVKLTILEIWNAFLMEVFVFLSAMSYATYEILIRERLSTGIYVSMITAIGGISNNIRGLTWSISYFMSHGIYIENFKKFLEYEPAAKSSYDNGMNSVEKTFQLLELKNISFSYEGLEKPVIKNVSLTINRGEKVAFVGYNGAGKTTLVKLIMGLYELNQGSIHYNGKDIKDLNYEEYRDIFATIFQDFQLYALSIAENVIMDVIKTEKDKQKVIGALCSAGFEEKLNTIDKGIDAVITHEFDDNGVLLSGGEAQKIAVARVFAKDCEIAILDEPSSALDPIAEFDMYNNLMKASEGKTVIFISHRLSSARMADKIYMLEDGEIVEQGTHEALMALGGKYAEMFRKQAESYTEETEIGEVV